MKDERDMLERMVQDRDQKLSASLKINSFLKGENSKLQKQLSNTVIEHRREMYSLRLQLDASRNERDMALSQSTLLQKEYDKILTSFSPHSSPSSRSFSDPDSPSTSFRSLLNKTSNKLSSPPRHVDSSHVIVLQNQLKQALQAVDTLKSQYKNMKHSYDSIVGSLTMDLNELMDENIRNDVHLTSQLTILDDKHQLEIIQYQEKIKQLNDRIDTLQGQEHQQQGQGQESPTPPILSPSDDDPDDNYPNYNNNYNYNSDDSSNDHDNDEPRVHVLVPPTNIATYNHDTSDTNTELTPSVYTRPTKVVSTFSPTKTKNQDKTPPLSNIQIKSTTDSKTPKSDGVIMTTKKSSSIPTTTTANDEDDFNTMLSDIESSFKRPWTSSNSNSISSSGSSPTSPSNKALSNDMMNANNNEKSNPHQNNNDGSSSKPITKIRTSSRRKLTTTTNNVVEDDYGNNDVLDALM
jgi:hypothetical protein